MKVCKFFTKNLPLKRCPQVFNQIVSVFKPD